MRRGERADWRGGKPRLVMGEERDPNISNNERGTEPVSHAFWVFFGLCSTLCMGHHVLVCARAAGQETTGVLVSEADSGAGEFTVI